MSTEALTKKEFNLYRKEFKEELSLHKKDIEHYIEEFAYSIKLGFDEMEKKFEEVTSGNDALMQRFIKFEQELVFNQAGHERFDERIIKLENPSK